jgi:hypothetical protein
LGTKVILAKLKFAANIIDICISNIYIISYAVIAIATIVGDIPSCISLAKDIRPRRGSLEAQDTRPNNYRVIVIVPLSNWRWISLPIATGKKIILSF